MSFDVTIIIIENRCINTIYRYVIILRLSFMVSASQMCATSWYIILIEFETPTKYTACKSRTHFDDERVRGNNSLLLLSLLSFASTSAAISILYVVMEIKVDRDFKQERTSV